MFERVNDIVIKNTVTKPAEEVVRYYNINDSKIEKANIETELIRLTERLAEVNSILAEDAKLAPIKVEEPMGGDSGEVI